MHFLKQHQPCIYKEDILTREGIEGQNVDNDIDEPKDIIEDVDNNNNDDDDNAFDSFYF